MESVVMREAGFSEVERKIINLLKTNARLSVREIARILGVSPTTVSRKLAKLERMGYIRGYVAITDDSKLGYECSLLLLIKLDKDGDPDLVAKEISQLDESCMCLTTVGTYDVVTLVTCRNPAHVENLMRKLRAIAGVSSIESFFVVRRYKMMNVNFYG